MPSTPMKRNFQTMIEPQPIMMDVSYHDFSQGYHYVSSPPPPPATMLLSHSFNAPDGGYGHEVYGPVPTESGFYPAHRASPDSAIHFPGDSFGSMSNNSSCSTSLSATSPPPQLTRMPAVPIPTNHIIPRQKAKRTATACEECRKRKQKCDGGSPCQSCKEQKLECKYREVTPTKKDTSMEQLVQLVENFSKSMEAINQRLEDMSASMRLIERRTEVIERRLSRCFQCGSAVELETGVCDSCTSHVPCRL